MRVLFVANGKFTAKLPFKWGNNGGWNWLPSDAKCVGKNIGGVPRVALLSSIGRKPFVLWMRGENKSAHWIFNFKQI